MTALTPRTELTPAQKAWVTRRARDVARAVIVTKRQGTDKLSPLAGEKIVSYAPSETEGDKVATDIGAGRRLYVVVAINDSEAVLFYAPQLKTVRVDRLSFDRYAKPSPKSSPRNTAKLIRERMAQWRRCFPDECELACNRAERAIAKLKEATT
jgi:hypothetical protein